jgi:hypothetical protein
MLGEADMRATATSPDALVAALAEIRARRRGTDPPVAVTDEGWHGRIRDITIMEDRETYEYMEFGASQKSYMQGQTTYRFMIRAELEGACDFDRFTTGHTLPLEYRLISGETLRAQVIVTQVIYHSGADGCFADFVGYAVGQVDVVRASRGGRGVRVGET